MDVSNLSLNPMRTLRMRLTFGAIFEMMEVRCFRVFQASIRCPFADFLPRRAHLILPKQASHTTVPTPLHPEREPSREASTARHREGPSALPRDPLPEEEPGTAKGGFWFLLLALALGALAVLWVIQNELVHASIGVGGAVPPIPALAVTLLLVGAGYAARHFGLAPLLGQQRILLVYILITVAAAVASRPSLIFFFAAVSLPQYLASTQPDMARVSAQFPSWYALPQGESARRFYEGSPDGTIPWRDWMLPLAAWGLFLSLLLLTLYALLALMRRSWMESERLTFPIVQIPLRLTGGGGGPSIWRSPVLWIGFGGAAAFDAMNMLHAFYPSFPSSNVYFDVGAIFVDRPWSALAPMWISYRPEIFGIAYLMPTDVLFTTGVSYLLLRLWSVMKVAYGGPLESGYYDYQEIGMGAFLCIFVILVRRAWPDLKQSLRAAVRGDRADADEPLSPRVAWVILLLGVVLMTAWLRVAGLSLWLALTHLTLLLAVAIVYARIRAETGAPGIYLYPFWQQQNMLFNFFGSQGLAGGSERALTIFASLGGLSRGYYPEICAYGIEGMSLAGRARFSQRLVTMAVVAGLLLGLVFGGYLYLQVGYRYGLSQIPGSYQTGLVRQQYDALIQMMAVPRQPRPDLMAQTLFGAGIALLISGLRQRLFWFPFHPIGFALASAYGFHLWAPFLIVWTLKVLILRLGGDRGYRLLMPLFLGLALGRYLFSGIVWGLLGITGHPAVESYQIHFG